MLLIKYWSTLFLKIELPSLVTHIYNVFIIFENQRIMNQMDLLAANIYSPIKHIKLSCFQSLFINTSYISDIWDFFNYHHKTINFSEDFYLDSAWAHTSLVYCLGLTALIINIYKMIIAYIRPMIFSKHELHYLNKALNI